jgi:hypothetical protein
MMRPKMRVTYAMADTVNELLDIYPDGDIGMVVDRAKANGLTKDEYFAACLICKWIIGMEEAEVSWSEPVH